MSGLLNCSIYSFDLGVDKPSFHQYPPHMQSSTRVVWPSQAMPLQGGTTVLLESLQLIAGDTRTVQAKSSYSTFPVLLLLYSLRKVFQTNTQVQKNIAQEMNLSLGGYRAKRICSTPLQVSRRLVLIAMQPETCSFLNPTFHDPQWTLYCFDTWSPGLGQQPALPAYRRQPTIKSAILPPDLTQTFTSLVAPVKQFGCKPS